MPERPAYSHELAWLFILLVTAYLRIALRLPKVTCFHLSEICVLELRVARR